MSILQGLGSIFGLGPSAAPKQLQGVGSPGTIIQYSGHPPAYLNQQIIPYSLKTPSSKIQFIGFLPYELSSKLFIKIAGHNLTSGTAQAARVNQVENVKDCISTYIRGNKYGIN